jgi:hypothetical protein
LGYICRRVETPPNSTINSQAIEDEPPNGDKSKFLNKDPIEPIINRGEHGKLTTPQIYERLSSYMPKSVDKSFMDDLKDRLLKKHQEKFYKNNFKEFYDVFLPNKNFKKSSKLTNDSSNNPNYKLFMSRRNSDQLVLPNTIDLIQMSKHTNCLYAFVNQSNGTDISYYKFNTSQQLPSLY